MDIANEDLDLRVICTIIKIQKVELGEEKLEEKLKVRRQRLSRYSMKSKKKQTYIRSPLLFKFYSKNILEKL